MPTTEQIIQRLNKLKSTLLTSGLSQTNQPLFEVINRLIQAIIDSNVGVVEITGGSGSGGLANQPYLTHQNALADLPSSRQLLAGDNVNFDDSVFGERTIDVLLDFIINADLVTWTDETASFPDSRWLLAGPFITIDTSVAGQIIISAVSPDREWSVLTNGDAVNPELIFADGDVIMTHIP